MFNRLLGIAGVLALLATVALVSPQRGKADGTENVRVLNSRKQPNFVRDVDDAFQPVQMTVPITWGDGSTLANTVAMVVPARKRFVLEDLSIRADVPSGQLVLEAGVQLDAPNPVRYVFLPVTFTGSGASDINPRPGIDEFHGGRLAHAYAEPGKEIGVYAYRNSTDGTGVAFISISGYLADL